MMKNKAVLYVISICLPFLAWGQTNPYQTLSLSETDTIINQLQQQLHESYLEEMKEEVDSQGLMIADWDGYSHEIQKVKVTEEQIKQIKHQLNLLEQHKIELLNQHPSKS